MDAKKQIINCHTHIFSSSIFPPYLAKSFAVWPLYLIRTAFIIRIIKKIYDRRDGIASIRERKWYKSLVRQRYFYRAYIRRQKWLWMIIVVFNNMLILNMLYFFFRKQIYGLLGFWPWLREKAVMIKDEFINYGLLWPEFHTVLQWLILFFIFLFIRNGRKILFGLLRNTFKFLSLLPNKKTIDFYKRYIYLGRYAGYEASAKIFEKLYNQYEDGTGFILLPMDMAYMDAGQVEEKGSYFNQLNQLAAIKTRNIRPAYPFFFVDPRRIEADGKSFLDYKTDRETGEVTLNTCMAKEFLEDKKFNGIKIYPALGYYPFDERLLILWKYAADRQIPIMTHAIRGTIFYRGIKKKEWNCHPVFQQLDGFYTGERQPLLLPELRNIDFINNFTHPLNYFLLVEPKALAYLLATCTKPIQDFFGYTGVDQPLNHDLHELKLCFGHYGGDDEWKRNLEADRTVYAPQLIRYPGRGIEFLDDGEFSPTKCGILWKEADWYSIISSLILQYPNLYADISYIVHDPEIYPLLKHSLQFEVLKKRILFGTDFYVVRNHKSDKEILGELKMALSETEFDLIARENPRTYLGI